MNLDDRGGIMYADYSVPAITEAIEYLIDRSDVHEGMVQALYHVCKDHTWTERASRIYHGIRSYAERS